MLLVVICCIVCCAGPVDVKVDIKVLNQVQFTSFGSDAPLTYPSTQWGLCASTSAPPRDDKVTASGETGYLASLLARSVAFVGDTLCNYGVACSWSPAHNAARQASMVRAQQAALDIATCNVQLKQLLAPLAATDALVVEIINRSAVAGLLLLLATVCWLKSVDEVGGRRWPAYWIGLGALLTITLCLSAVVMHVGHVYESKQTRASLSSCIGWHVAAKERVAVMKGIAFFIR